MSSEYSFGHQIFWLMFTHEATNLVCRPLLRLLLLMVQAYKGPLLIICVNASSPHWTQSSVQKMGHIIMNLQYTQTLISFLLAHQSSPFRCCCCLSVVIMFPWQLLGKFLESRTFVVGLVQTDFVNKCFVASTLIMHPWRSLWVNTCSSHFRSCINFAYAWLFQVLLLSTKIISP